MEQKSKVQIGKEFEAEAFEILKDKFDKVEWLSKNKRTTFDFKCWKDGKEYDVDAKVNSPILKYSQRDADYLIVKKKNGVEILGKERISKLKPQGEGKRVILIRKEDYENLKKYKVHPNQSIAEVIKKLLDEEEIIKNHLEKKGGKRK